MHPNANITFQLQETRKMMDAVLSIQVGRCRLIISNPVLKAPTV